MEEQLYDSEYQEEDVQGVDRTSVSEVNANTVHMSQSGAQRVYATEVNVRQGGVNQIEADQVTVEQGGVLMVDADQVDLNQGGIGFVRAQNASFEEGSVGVLVAGSADLKESNSGVVIAQQVKADSIKTTFLLAGAVEGTVETVLDTQQAMLFGAASGLAIGGMLFLGKLFRSPKKVTKKV